MELNYELIGVLFVAPVVIWVGIFAWISTFEGEVSQIQSAVLFCLAFFLLASFVILNLAMKGNLTLLTIAFVETVGLSALLYLRLKKVLAKQ